MYTTLMYVIVLCQLDTVRVNLEEGTSTEKMPTQNLLVDKMLCILLIDN